MLIATWNINGIKARIDGLLSWLKEAEPDVVCLQEIKSEDDPFPRGPIESLGYNVETHGQKGFNGVALLSKRPFEEVNRGLPGDEDDAQARFMEGMVPTDDGIVRVAGIYLPNGNPVEDPAKFEYKLAWMDRLHAWAEERLALEEPLLIAGDYNVIPLPEDCFSPAAWEGDALFHPESRDRFEALKALGFADALRTCTDEVPAYTFWDYQAGAWRKNNGIRIDHILTSPEATNRIHSVRIDRHVRDWEKPSDHVPVVLDYGT